MPHDAYTNLFSKVEEDKANPAKKEAILAVKKVEKDINALKENVNEAKKLLKSGDDFSADDRKKLLTVILKGNEHIELYGPQLKSMQERVAKL